MKRLVLGWLILTVMTASLVGQEIKHAPTFQSCDADLNLWSSQIRGFPTSTREQDQESTKSLAVVEMTNRMSYLNDCALAYPVFNKNRPGELTAKFYEEDEAGKR